MVDDVNAWQVAFFFAVAVWSAPAALDRLERVGALPRRVGQWWFARAQRTVADHEREAALTELAGKTEEILRALSPDSGGSVYDMAKMAQDTGARIEERLNAHIEQCNRDHDALYQSMEMHEQNQQQVFRRLRALEGR